MFDLGVEADDGVRADEKDFENGVSAVIGDGRPGTMCVCVCVHVTKMVCLL
jgi:hypothetical protein